MSTITIRSATLNDQHAVLSLVEELSSLVKHKTGREQTPGAITNVENSVYPEMIADKNCRIFLAEENGTPVGVVTFYKHPHLGTNSYQCKIGHLIVAAAHRGKGIGKQLLDAVKQYSGEQGAKMLTLTSSNELTDAHRFYEQNGGKITSKGFKFEL